ncbi:BMP family ABC transporter substrate-binding protein [Anaerolineae bacterium CFX9]|jgi:simple sugar transport system substrate-binding protein|nr:BMP family ABC transporter substrate-binding protein [Anaerolineae bacterium CFX9]
MKKSVLLLVVMSVLALLAAPVVAQDEFVFGLVLVGPQNDRGWSQAHYEGGLYVEQNVPGTRMLLFPSLNPADAPETTLFDVVDEMVDQGARLIFTTSDAFEEDTDGVAEAFPDVTFINISGDNVLTGEAPPNLGNLMGQMEWGKLIAGCAAGLATETGSIGYLGPLINGETRRMAASSYLGARYCYEHYKGGNPDDLTFTVTWIGFWFNIPGVTLDPTEETNSFFDSGADVVISGIDTTEVIVVAGQRAANGENVFAVPYDYEGACAEAPSICLGVPYFHWGPDYARIVQSVMDGTWEQAWEWTGPDWSDINNPDTSAIGFHPGEGLGENAAALEDFIAELAAYATNAFVPDSFALWRGPLSLQDGTVLAEEGQLVDILDVWYLPQLLEGMVGASS